MTSHKWIYILAAALAAALIAAPPMMSAEKGSAAPAASAVNDSSSALENLPKLPTVKKGDLAPSVLKLVEKAVAAKAALRMDYLSRLSAGADPSVKGLVYLLAHNDARIRWAAVSALGKTKGSKTALTAVRAMLADSNWGVREGAANSLGRIGEPSDEALLAALAQSDSSKLVKLAAQGAVASIKRRAANPNAVAKTPPKTDKSTARPAAVSLFPPGTKLSAEGPGKKRPRKVEEWVSDKMIKTSSKRIDDFVYAKIEEAGLEASGQASDGAFLRRIWLDLAGVIPTAEEAEKIVKTGAGGNRARVIDDLLESEEYLDHWASLWTGWLIGRSNPNSREATRLRAWVRDALKDNMPYDVMVRELIATTGPTHEIGAAEYYVRFNLDSNEMTSRTSRTFLGLPLQCAQCHDHKSEPWLQEQFYGVKAFFDSVRRERVEVEDADGNEQYVGSYLRDRKLKTARVPEKEMDMPATFLDGQEWKGVEGISGRLAYANWITDGDNPYFAKATVNRIWDYFTGAGIVDPIDWFGVSTIPSHPELLDWLAEDFVRHGYNLRYLTRAIMNSEMYQRSAKTTDLNKSDDYLLTHARIRPLTAEQLFYSLLEATNIASRQTRRGENVRDMKQRYLRQFTFTFGNDEMEEDEMNNPTIAQALMMLNGSLVNDGIVAKEGTRLAYILSRHTETQRRLEQIYLATLSRMPTGAERSYFRSYMNGYKRDPKRAYEDLYWSLLNSAEFASNH